MCVDLSHETMKNCKGFPGTDFPHEELQIVEVDVQICYMDTMDLWEGWMEDI